MHRAILLLLPLAWLLSTGEAAPPNPTLQTATPIVSASPTQTPPPPPTPTPSPRTGYLALDPTFGPPGSKVTISGSQFVPAQQVQLYLDTPDKLLGAPLAADASGNFKVEIAVPDVAVGPHTICSPQATASTPCANFRLEPKPSPTPSETPSPSPVATPSAEPSTSPTEVAASPAAERLDTVGVLTRPPFVFFPILLVLAAAAAGAWIWWGRRRPPAPVRSAVVRHASVTPRPSTLPTQPAPPAPSAPPAAESPPPPRAAPGDESIDMPQPGE